MFPRKVIEAFVWGELIKSLEYIQKHTERYVHTYTPQIYKHIIAIVI